MAFDPDVVNIPASPVQEEIKKQDEQQQQQEEQSVNPFLFDFNDDKKEVKFEDFQQGLFKLGFDEETANNIFNIFDTDDSKDVDEEEYNFVLNSMKSAGIEVSEDGITAENLSEYQAKLEEDKKQEEQLIELDMTSLGDMVQNGELPEAQNNALSDLAKELGTQLANATSTLNTVTGELIVTTADNQIFKIDANGNRIDYTKEQSIVNPDDIEHLNAKYNLGIDFDNPENMTDEQILRLQQAYVLEENAQQLDANYQAMLNYFDTLGAVDEAYDGIKDFLNAGLTREDIENYYNNEKLKQDFLTSVIQNGGSIEVDSNIQETASALVYNVISASSSADEVIRYATDVLGMTIDEIENYAKETIAKSRNTNPEDVTYNIKAVQNEDGEYVLELHAEDGTILNAYEEMNIEDFARTLSNNLKIKEGDSLSFEQAYKLSTGVKYNEQLIADVFNTKPVYENVAQQQQSAVILEQMMAQMSPSEALDYFNQMAESYNDGRTGEDLFNEYYQNMFEKYPDTMQEINNGYEIQCNGVSIQDGYLWYELTLPEDNPEEFVSSMNLYKQTDENGNTKYYQVVKADDTGIVKTNKNGKEENFRANAWTESYYTTLFSNINCTIKDNNLYLETIKKDFNKKYGENAFDAILEEYPKMYAKAFGQNELSNKIKEYQEDMDSYSQKLSQTLSIGCFVAGFIPGVNLGIAPILIAAASDNIIDAINIKSNNLSAEQKQQQRNQLLLNTALEVGMFLVSMKINGIANTAGNKLTHDLISKGCSFAINHANWTEALIEYGVDNLASIAWDFGKGLATGDFLDDDGNFCWDKVGSMILNNLKFNTADLRNGMAFYRSIKAGDSIDLGNGTRFKIDQNDGTVEYTYNNGSKVTIENGRATLTEANSTTYNLTFNKATGSWELPDGTKVDLADSNSIPKSYTVRNGVAEYTTSDGIKVTVPESVIRNLAARGADLDSAIKAQYELFDALNRPIAQTDGTTCIPVSSLNELAQKSGILQALLNEIEPVEGKPGYYRIDKFGDDFEFKLDGETNPLQKIYEMYQASRFGENSEGDYVPNFLTDLLGGGNEVRQTLNNDNLPAIREYLNDNDTILVASFDGVEGLSNGHAYRIVSIDETTNRMTVQDTDGTQIEIDAESYMGKVQIEGMSYGNLPALVDPSLEARLLGGMGNQPAATDYTAVIGSYAVKDQSANISDVRTALELEGINIEGMTDEQINTIVKIANDNNYTIDGNSSDCKNIADAVRRGVENTSQYQSYIQLKTNHPNEILVFNGDGSITKYASAEDEINGKYTKIDANGNIIEEGWKDNDGIEHTRKYNIGLKKANKQDYTETWTGTDGIEHKRVHIYGEPSDKYKETWKDSKGLDYTRNHKAGDPADCYSETIVEKDPKTNKLIRQYSRKHKAGDPANEFTLLDANENETKYKETVTGGKYNEISYTDKNKTKHTLYYPAGEIPDFAQQGGISINYRHITCRNSANGPFVFEWNSDNNVHLTGVHTIEAMNELTKATKNNPHTIQLSGNRTAIVAYHSTENGARLYTVTYGSGNNTQVTWIKVNGRDISFSATSSSFGNPKTVIPQAVYDNIQANRADITLVKGTVGCSYFAVLDTSGHIHYFQQKGITTFEVPAKLLEQGVQKTLKSIPMVKISGW